jgi:hypothetical protein
MGRLSTQSRSRIRLHDHFIEALCALITDLEGIAHCEAGNDTEKMASVLARV